MELHLPAGWVDAWDALHPGDPGYTYDPKSNPMLTSRWAGQRLDRWVGALVITVLGRHFGRASSTEELAISMHAHMHACTWAGTGPAGMSLRHQYQAHSRPQAHCPLQPKP